MKNNISILNKILSIMKKYDKEVLIFYKIFIDIIYVLGISSIFSYSGFKFNFSIYKYIIGWLVFCFAIKYVKKLFNKDTFSDIIVLLIFLIYFVPNITMYGMMSLSDMYFFISTLYMFILLIANENIGFIKFKSLKQDYSKLVFYIALIIIPLFIFYVSYKYTGFRLVTDFINVYDIRLESKMYNMPVITKYILSLVNVIVPLMFVYCMRQKKIVYCIIMIFTQYVLFSITAQKNIALLIVIVLLSYFLYKTKYKRLIILLIIIGSLFCPFESNLFGTHYIISLIYRRNFFLPPFISNQYYLYFNQHSFDFFTNGLMSWLGFDSVYPDSISNVLGNAYAYASTNLNNGMIGDAFANLGYLGILLMPIVIVITFRFMDAFTNKIPRNIIFGFAVYYMMKFVNGFWSINLLSGGFLVLIIFLYLMQNEKDEDNVLQNQSNISLKTIFDKLRLNYIKIIIGVSLSVVISVGYFYLARDNFYEKKNYQPYEFSTILDEQDKFIYYSQLYNLINTFDKEINEFVYYYKIDDLNYLKNLNDVSEVLKDYDVSILKYVNDNGKFYNYYNKQSENYIDIEEYYDLIEEYYDYFNLVNMELDQNDNIMILYTNKDNVISDYNIELVETNNDEFNKLGAGIIFVSVTSLVSICYIIIAGIDKDSINKIKKFLVTNNHN